MTLTFCAVRARFCLSVPSFQAASSKLTCVRSLKCNIQRYQGCYAVKGMCRCAQAWCCNNPFNYSSLQSCLSVAENTVHLGKKSLRKDDQCEHCRVVYGSFAITVGSIATLCVIGWKILRHPALIHSNQSKHARSQAIPALGVLDSFWEVIGSQNHRLALWLADTSSHTGTWDLIRYWLGNDFCNTTAPVRHQQSPSFLLAL